MLRKMKSLTSDDGSMKIGYKTYDGHIIETVILPRGEKVKVCVSTQVGCGFACMHCLTGTVGLKRNLNTEEIFLQVKYSLEEYSHAKQPQVIFFGSGEPFLNYDNVIECTRKVYNTLSNFNDYQQIQISTSGVKGKIQALADLDISPKLAVSIHSAIADKRKYLIPQSQSFDLLSLRQELLYYQAKKAKKIIIHYSLMKGFNDDKASAECLAEYIQGLDTVIYIIPFNPYPGSRFCRPTDETAQSFVAELDRLGLQYDYRPSRGGDISGACGQLTCDLKSKIRGSNRSRVRV